MKSQRDRFSAAGLIVAMAALLPACKPNAPTPDLIAPQRAALNKAKAVEGQLQDDLQQRMKAVDKDQ